MKETMTITLNDLQFAGFHGLYPEEKIIGNELQVDLEVSFQPGKGTITGIEETINYASLYEIVKKEMSSPADLLESLAMDLANRIHQHFPFIEQISVQIRKLHPPMAGFQGNAGVRYHRSY